MLKKGFQIVLFVLFSLNLVNAQSVAKNKTQSSKVKVTSACDLKLSGHSKAHIYEEIMQFISTNDEFEAGKIFSYRIETIKPKYLESLSEIRNIREDTPKSLINNFIKENETVYKLPQEMPFKLSIIGGVKGDIDILNFAKSQNDKFPTIQIPVLLISNLAFDDSYRQGLVYVEFYGFQQKVIKKYLRFILKRDEWKNDEINLSGFYFVDQIPVGIENK